MKRLTHCTHRSVERMRRLSLVSPTHSPQHTPLVLPAIASSSSCLSINPARFASSSAAQAARIPLSERQLTNQPGGPYYATPTPRFRVQKPRYNHIPNFCTPVIPPLPSASSADPSASTNTSSPTSTAAPTTFFTIPAYQRNKLGTHDSRRLREQRNHIPVAVFQRHTPNRNPLALSLERADVERLVRHWLEPCLMTRVGTLQVRTEGGEVEGLVDVVIADMVRHSVSNEILHMSFIHYDPTHRHRLAIPVQYINEAESVGVRRGGLLLHIKHAVQCVYTGPPQGIPSKFIVDLMNVGMGAVINNTDIAMVPGLKLHAPQKQYVLAVIQGLGRQFRQQQDEAEGVPAAGGAATPAAGAAAPAAGATKKEEPKKK